jgi:hypothetical protein
MCPVQADDQNLHCRDKKYNLQLIKKLPNVANDVKKILGVAGKKKAMAKRL